MTEPAPRGNRNPRRAYDADGREIAPATVKSSAAIGAHSIQVSCNACHHGIVLGLDGLPGTLAIPDIPIALRLRCGACGSSNIGVMMDVHAHYARVRETMGQAPEAEPGDYRIIPWQDVVGPARAVRLAAGEGYSSSAPSMSASRCACGSISHARISVFT